MIKKRSLVQFSYRQCWNIIKKKLSLHEHKSLLFPWAWILPTGQYSQCYPVKCSLGFAVSYLPKLQTTSLSVSQYSKQYYPILILELKQCFHFLEEVTWQYRFLQANIYLFKVNDRNISKMCEICSKLTIKTVKRNRSDVFIVNLEHILHLFLVFLLLTLNK